MNSQNLNSAMNTDLQFIPHNPSFTKNTNLPLITPKHISSTNPNSLLINSSSSVKPPPIITNVPSSFKIRRNKSSHQKTLTLASPLSQRRKPYKPKLLNLSKEIPPCSECGKQFHSAKALHGHMRCHPERNWRGIKPPEKQTRPVMGLVRVDLSKLTEYEIQAAKNIVLISKGQFEAAKEVNIPSGIKKNKSYKKKNGIFEKRNGISGAKKSILRSDLNSPSVAEREEGGAINLNPTPNPNVVLDLELRLGN